MSLKSTTLLAIGLGLASPVGATPLDRLPGASGLVFDQGNVLSFSGVWVSPSVSGQVAPPVGPASGNVAPAFLSGRIGLKYDLGSGRHLALALGSSWGLLSRFEQGTGFPLEGLGVSVEATRASLLYRHGLGRGWDAVVGVNLEQLSGSASIQRGPLAYGASLSSTPALGFVGGLAWSRPETATSLRLTFESAIVHNVTYTEQVGVFPPSVTTAPLVYPASLTLEAQTGIAADTVLMSSLRWSDWSAFQLAPPVAAGLVGPFASGGGDTYELRLGLGRKLSENWNGAVFVSTQFGGSAPNFLMPSAGRHSLALALQHDAGPWVTSFGVQYTLLSNADVAIPTPLGPAPSRFEGNSALAVVADVKFRF